MALTKHLNQKVFDTTVEQIPTRNGYGDALLDAGKEDERIVALCADLTESTRTHLFAEAFPHRFVQVGIAEQNMASVASGMAAMGKIPFVASYAMFSPGRSWEQVRTTIAYNNSNVKIIGAHAGISVGPDGATHQSIEDIALMRVLPNMVVISPCDAHETYRAVRFAASYDAPVYIRVTREKTPVITTKDSPFVFGKAEVFYTPECTRTVGIIATGPVLYYALKAAKQLDDEGIGVSVLNVPTIKPLDHDGLTQFAQDHQFLVTVEEHQIAGGLFGAVAESLVTRHPCKILPLGVHDQFGQSGTPEELLAHYGMNTEAVKKTIKEALI